jgi:uncharacterized membrane protein
VTTSTIQGTVCDCLDSFGLAGTPQNIGQWERVASVASGAGLLVFGLRQCSLSGLLLGGVGAGLLYRGLTGHCHLYQALGVSTNDDSATRGGVPAQTGLKVEKTLSIERPARELFDHWRKFENLAHLMPNIESVRDLGNGCSHWVAKGPFGAKLEWDAEVHHEEPGRLIAWKSLPGGDIETAGSVHFDERPTGGGCDLYLSLKYNPPLGVVGAELAWLMGQGVEQKIEENLWAFKRKMEAAHIERTGEPRPVEHAAGQPLEGHLPRHRQS